MTWEETFAIRRGPHEAKSRIIASATGEINWLRQPFIPSPEFIEGSKEATRVRRTQTEMPLDAEDFVLASLEARVRAEEARVDLGSENLQAAVTIRLPRPLLLRLRAQAAQRNVTPSRLIELALAQYLPLDSAGRRGR
ncbi:MAG: hypothetical protein HW409_1221 [candidate division NC10 bacterium]|nr:hypothetical protein [candidate division NC10 bacterium]